MDSGAVFVSRGMLALLNDGGELARIRHRLATGAALVVLVGFLLVRTPEPPNRDRFRAAEERLEVERARGHLDQSEIERLRLALRIVREGVDTPRYKVLRGDVLRSATTEISACRITVLTPWIDEQVGVAERAFTPVDR